VQLCLPSILQKAEAQNGCQCSPKPPEKAPDGFAHCRDVKRKRAPKSKPAAALAAKKTFETLSLINTIAIYAA
jgi:hypothetical protein